MSSFGGGETIQLSFGPAANAVTSHLCNLQGLASTSATVTDVSDVHGSGSDTTTCTPLCDPYVTHAVQNEIYVPRVLFVDGRNHFTPWPTSLSSTSSLNANTNTNTNWGGAVEIHHRVPIYNNNQDENRNKSSINSNDNDNDNDNDHHRQHSHHFVDNSRSTYEYNSNQLSNVQRNAWDQFQSSTLSTSTMLNDKQSRYHSLKYQHVSSQYIYSPSNNNNNNNNSNISSSNNGGGRYMQWDDDEEEEEEDEDEYYKQRKLQLERQRWDQREVEIQNELDDAWNTFITGTSTNTTAAAAGTTGTTGQKRREHEGNNNNDDSNTASTTTRTTRTTNPLHHIQWLNYFMPPHPNEKMYTAPLPFDHIINIHEHNNTNKNILLDQPILYSHCCGKYPSPPSHNSYSSTTNALEDGITTEYREDLSDKIRKWMEDCDALRGVQILIDNDKSLYGGLACSVLEELGDECRSAGRVSVMVHGGDIFDMNTTLPIGGGGGGGGLDEDGAGASSYWRSERKVVHSFRSHLNDGLNLHGIAENSDLVLPLSLNQCWKSLGRQSTQSTQNTSENMNEMTLFEASAAGALALEAVTLPYRLLKQSQSAVSQSSSLVKRRSKIGILSGYFQGSGQSDDNDAFPTIDRLSYHEFISSLRPSNRHTVLELSGSTKNQNIDDRLLQGTSIERRRLEEERERNRNSMYYRRGRGRDIDPGLWIEDSGTNGGILCPLSPSSNDNQLTSRSMHRHFSLMTALRPSNTVATTDQVSTYTTLIMEGMGIRYRPQSSVGTVVRQSIYDLTSSKSYAAGTYWKSIFNNQIQNVPVLTVLGNSTRSYSHLKTTANNISQSLSRKYQGYLSRDSTAGIVPEREDCTDALEHIMDLRDTYEPPMMFDDEDHEGTYFDDNSE